MKLKELKAGEEMPKDFWNYNVNPILGYKSDSKVYNNIAGAKKYGIAPIPHKQ